VIKIVLHKAFSVILAFAVLFSTLSFTVEKHFCGDRLVDVAVFTDVKGCGMEMRKIEKEKIPCCKDEVEIIKGQDDLKLDRYNDLSLSQALVLSAYIYSYGIVFESFPKQIIPHRHYLPPNLVADIQLLDQVFLI
jgi:hypothetical protein